jgi:rare lipoprotein A
MHWQRQNWLIQYFGPGTISRYSVNAILKTGIAILTFSLILGGCSTNRPGKPDSGGFYGGDRPPTYGQRDFDKIPDAIPRVEPLSRTGNSPYKALGKSYTPLKSSRGYVKRGVASWYGTKFHGRRTSSGESYDMWGMTAAHPVLPLPTYVEVSNLETGKKIVVKVNDRGPFLHGRIIDLSFAAAHKLGIADKGTGRVEVRAIDPGTFPGTDNQVHNTWNPEKVENQGSRNYYIQVGAFSSIDNAMNMRDIIVRQGYTVYPKTSQQMIAQGQPYRVKTGPISTLESALQSQYALEKLLGQKLVLIAD